MTETPDKAAVATSPDTWPGFSQVIETFADFDLARFDYPQQDEWVMAAQTMRLVGRIVELVRPRRILEFGSGRSTLVLAATAATYGGRVLSFEHRERFARQTTKTLEEWGAAHAAQVAHRRLSLRRYGVKALPTYSIDWRDFEDFRECELALVDGPPGYIGREATLFELFPRLAVGAWVVVDDVNRTSERRWLESWRRAFGDALQCEILPTIGEGAALLRKRASATPSYPTTATHLRDIWEWARSAVEWASRSG